MIVCRGNLFGLAVSFAVRMKNDIQKVVKGKKKMWLYRKGRVGGDGVLCLCSLWQVGGGC